MFLKQIFVFMVTALMVFPSSGIAEAEKTMVFLPEIEVRSGQAVQMPVKISLAENLAGMKLVIEYDQNLIKYEKMQKTEVTSCLMHVVNDQKPGRLIIVMAGAKGISGKNIILCNIYFNTLADVAEKQISEINITEIELMSDALKEIPCKPSGSLIILLPSEKTDQHIMEID